MIWRPRYWWCALRHKLEEPAKRREAWEQGWAEGRRHEYIRAVMDALRSKRLSNTEAPSHIYKTTPEVGPLIEALRIHAASRVGHGADLAGKAADALARLSQPAPTREEEPAEEAMTAFLNDPEAQRRSIGLPSGGVALTEEQARRLEDHIEAILDIHEGWTRSMDYPERGDVTKQEARKALALLRGELGGAEPGEEEPQA